MRQRDQPGLGAVVQIALDPAQLGRLHIERSAARAGELVDAKLKRTLPGTEEGSMQREREHQSDEHRKIGQK